MSTVGTRTSEPVVTAETLLGFIAYARERFRLCGGSPSNVDVIMMINIAILWNREEERKECNPQRI